MKKKEEEEGKEEKKEEKEKKKEGGGEKEETGEGRRGRKRMRTTVGRQKKNRKWGTPTWAHHMIRKTTDLQITPRQPKCLQQPKV